MPKSESAKRMAETAQRFLASLFGPELAAAGQTFEAEARRDWHYVPRTRPGLAFRSMQAVQQKAAYDLLATGLSLPAFAAATTIVGLEDALDVIEGGRRGRHRADYSTTVFGDPSSDAPWGWRFEGHHISLNVAIADSEVSGTPLFLGANPAEVTTDRGSVVTRPLAGEEDLALALVAELSGPQRAEALLDADAPADILTTNAPSLEGPLLPLGLRFAELHGAAHDRAEDLVRMYLDRLPAPLSAVRWERLQPDFGDVAFVFAGEATHRRPHYYRLQGPHFFVEYDNTQDDANHVHTVLRDPEGDFGDDLLRAHRKLHHRA